MLKAVMLAQTLAAILGWCVAVRGWNGEASVDQVLGNSNTCIGTTWWQWWGGVVVADSRARPVETHHHFLLANDLSTLGKLNGNLCGRKTISLGKFSSFLHRSVFVFAAEKILPSLLRCISNNRIILIELWPCKVIPYFW